MRKLKKLVLWLIAWRIEGNLRNIDRNRKQMKRLIAGKVPYTSDKLIRLDMETARLGQEAMTMQRCYHDMERAG